MNYEVPLARVTDSGTSDGFEKPRPTLFLNVWVLDYATYTSVEYPEFEEISSGREI